MIELNNIDFSKLEKNCKLPDSAIGDLWDKAMIHADSYNYSGIVVAAFELGASLAHQAETKKVCMLCKPF